jgi:putative transcriptional regulator
MPRQKRKEAVSPGRGARLKAARQRAGFSQEQLAERAGCRKLTVLRIEKGSTRPTVDLAIAFGRELGESVESLFGGGR